MRRSGIYHLKYHLQNVTITWKCVLHEKTNAANASTPHEVTHVLHGSVRQRFKPRSTTPPDPTNCFVMRRSGIYHQKYLIFSQVHMKVGCICETKSYECIHTTRSDSCATQRYVTKVAASFKHVGEPRGVNTHLVVILWTRTNGRYTFFRVSAPSREANPTTCRINLRPKSLESDVFERGKHSGHMQNDYNSCGVSN